MRPKFTGNILGILLVTAMISFPVLPLNLIAVASDQIPTVVVNGTAIDPDVDPVIENDRVLVPLRAISEALGADVLWDSEEQKVTVTRGEIEIILHVGQNLAMVNGQTLNLDVPARIYSDRTMVPLRFISEAMGAVVSWDAAKWEAAITLEDNPVGNTEDPVKPPSEVTEYDTPGIWGPASGKQAFEGNVSLLADGITLRNVTVEGDLIIDESVDQGTIILQNVEVKGTLYVYGGGGSGSGSGGGAFDCSLAGYSGGDNPGITLNGCTLNNVIVDQDGVRIVSDGSTSVRTVTLESGATLIEISTAQGFQQVIINCPANITLQGDFDDVQLSSASTTLNLQGAAIENLTVGNAASGIEINIPADSSVRSLTLNGPASVQGTGQVIEAVINARGCSFQTEPQSVVNNSGEQFQLVVPEIDTIAVSNVETNNTFGGFKFTTSQVVTAEQLAGKFKAGNIIITGFEQRGAVNGKEWKALVTGAVSGQVYTLNVSLPFVLSGACSLSWDTNAPPVTGLSCSYDGSCIHALFGKADGENQRVNSYRVFIVESSSSLSLASANSAAASCYTVVARTNGSYDISIPLGTADANGNPTVNGKYYKAYVLTVADGTNATINCLTGPSNPVEIPAPRIVVPGADDSRPPAWVAGYPFVDGITHRQANLNMQIDEAGNTWYVIVADGAAAPSSAQVKNGQGADGLAAAFSGNKVLAANLTGSCTITGLSAATAYDLYTVAQDSSGNLQAAPVRVDFATTAAPPAATLLRAEFTSDGSISLVFNKAIDPFNFTTPNTGGLMGAFTVTMDGNPRALNSVQKTNSGTKVKIVPTAPLSGANVKISYTKPGDAAQQLIDIDGIAVNNIAETTVIQAPPVPLSAATTAEGDILITFDKNMDNSNLDQVISYFAVNVSGVTLVDRPAQKQIKLVLATKISAGQSVTVTYTKPNAANAAKRLRSLADPTSAVDSFTLNVTNNMP